MTSALWKGEWGKSREAVDGRDERLPLSRRIRGGIVDPANGSGEGEIGITGQPAKASRIAAKTLTARLRAVDRYPRICAKPWVPSTVRNPPETFCLTLTIRASLSAWLLSNSPWKSCRKAKVSAWKSRSRSRRFNGGVCAGRPRVFPPVAVGDGGGGCGLHKYPALRAAA
jgi:hypothetical protein